ncbi:MAG: Tol-Pal system beta propeller repeat protein TolB [Desulfarculus sp.]|nr:MAG: Tol-Pal system beta propeller repeat protein TolB [Desulfarculus sp.]
MTTRRILISLLALFLALGLAAPAAARVYIDITSPFSRKLPLALPEFQALDGAAADPFGAQASGLLKRYLGYTGLFDFMDPKTFLGPPEGEKINYRRWSRVGAELLITGEYKREGNVFALKLRLFDVTGAKQLVGRGYDGTLDKLGAAIARFCDEVMLALTGERSIYSTMIAFVGARDGKKEIYLMRFDGTGVQQLTHRQDISLYPAWSPDGALLSYSAYVNRRPAIMVHALAGGSGKVVLNKPGVNLTPAFRPQHQGQLAAALSYTGKNNIFLIDLAGKVLKQLTNGWGIEVDPAFSPDGKKMAFVSDRGGSPQIYVLDLASGSLRRLTFEHKYSAAPAWSPRGDRIAYQAEVNRTFQVATIRPDGSDLRILTNGLGGGENPTWSPDGRLIAYAGRKTGRYQIYLMTAGGEPITQLTKLPGDQSDPAWSPRGIMVK